MRVSVCENCGKQLFNEFHNDEDEKLCHVVLRDKLRNNLVTNETLRQSVLASKGFDKNGEELKKWPTEVIKHAAVKSIDGQIFLGKSHADCFHQAHNVGVKMSQQSSDQGFFTNKGRYVERKEAATIAKNSSQVGQDVFILFSEELWSQTDGGQFSYNSIDGYLRIENQNV
jgi:hypothetical protein